MSNNRHWTKRAARLIQRETGTKYMTALRFTNERQAEIERRSEGPDEDGLTGKQRLMAEALALYSESESSTKDV